MCFTGSHRGPPSTQRILCLPAQSVKQTVSVVLGREHHYHLHGANVELSLSILISRRSALENGLTADYSSLVVSSVYESYGNGWLYPSALLASNPSESYVHAEE